MIWTTASGRARCTPTAVTTGRRKGRSTHHSATPVTRTTGADPVPIPVHRSPSVDAAPTVPGPGGSGPAAVGPTGSGGTSTAEILRFPPAIRRARSTRPRPPNGKDRSVGYPSRPWLSSFPTVAVLFPAACSPARRSPHAGNPEGWGWHLDG